MASLLFADLSNQSSSGQLPGCNGDPLRTSCQLNSAQLGIWDAVAAIRMVMSCLSVLGASSIIIIALRKREVTNQKIHPIFVLSVDNLMLAVLWLVGGGLWLRRAPDRSWCLAVSLLTVILECVSVNLTVVYALLMYSTVRRIDLAGILNNTNSQPARVWGPVKTIIVYSIAWLFPAVIVLLIFAAIAGSTDIIQDSNDCSCWCAPLLGNTLPYAQHREEGTAKFVYQMRKLLISYGAVISTHFLFGFIILSIVYYLVLRWIRSVKDESRMALSAGFEGARPRGRTWSLVGRGEAKARKRVFYFLTVFAVTGLFNCILAFGYMIRELTVLSEGDSPDVDSDIASASFEPFYVTFIMLQSLTATQQGFLNAIVYGWTRDDFLHIVSLHSMSYEISSPVHSNTFSEDEDVWEVQSDEETEEMESEKMSLYSSIKSAHSVGGAKSHSVGEAKSHSVGGANSHSVGGANSHSVGRANSQSVGGANSHSVGVANSLAIDKSVGSSRVMNVR